MNCVKPVYFKTFETILFGSALMASVLAGSADAREATTGNLFFDCVLESSKGEHLATQIEAGAIGDVSFRINNLNVTGTFVPSLSEPAENFTFTTSIVGQVYTLVVHVDPFLPHPEGYDPKRPPATAAVHFADFGGKPKVETFFGNCALK